MKGHGRLARRWAAAGGLFVSLGAEAAHGSVLTGLDMLVRDGFAPLAGKRVGILTNQTGKDRQGTPTVEVLARAREVQLAAVFSPEHGFTGLSEENVIDSTTLRLPDGRAIPLYSLYGGTKTPTPEMLRGLDVLVFDIQDIGARFYTYITTMGLAMEAAARAGKEFIVLDRPNPIDGTRVEGAVLEPHIRHFTAHYSIPTRHGMTVGEIAGFHNRTAGLGLKLGVVRMEGWNRSLWYDETGLPWTKPSPNMPDLDAAALYPGIGCFESTNLAVGRGTKVPFRWVGAPWLKNKEVLRKVRAAGLAGVKFSAKNYKPSKSLHAGVKCRGLRIRTTDRRALKPLEVFVHLICAIRDAGHPEFAVRWDEIPRMVGTEKFKTLYESGAAAGDILRMFEEDRKPFEETRRRYLLYE